MPERKVFVVYPRSTQDFSDLSLLFDNYVIGNWAPPYPLLSKDDTVITFGSCFAQNIAEALAKLGLNALSLRLHEEANSPAINNAILDYLILGESAASAHVFKIFGLDEEKRQFVLSKIASAKCAIFTVGVGISAYEKATGRMVLRPNSANMEKLQWKFPHPDEQAKHILECFQKIRQINSEIALVCTVSPVPMFRGLDSLSPIVDDCVSKSLLRAAIHMVMSSGLYDLYYWPSFEMFRWVGAHVGPVYGQDDGMPRHVNTDLVSLIMSKFVQYFIVSDGGEYSPKSAVNIDIVPDN